MGGYRPRSNAISRPAPSVPPAAQQAAPAPTAASRPRSNAVSRPAPSPSPTVQQTAPLPAQQAQTQGDKTPTAPASDSAKVWTGTLLQGEGIGESAPAYQAMQTAYRAMEMARIRIRPEVESHDQLYQSCFEAQKAAETFLQVCKVGLLHRSKLKKQRAEAEQVRDQAKAMLGKLDKLSEPEIVSGRWAGIVTNQKAEESGTYAPVPVMDSALTRRRMAEDAIAEEDMVTWVMDGKKQELDTNQRRVAKKAGDDANYYARVLQRYLKRGFIEPAPAGEVPRTVMVDSQGAPRQATEQEIAQQEEARKEYNLHKGVLHGLGEVMDNAGRYREILIRIQTGCPVPEDVTHLENLYAMMDKNRQVGEQAYAFSDNVDAMKMGGFSKAEVAQRKGSAKEEMNTFLSYLQQATRGFLPTVGSIFGVSVTDLDRGNWVAVHNKILEKISQSIQQSKGALSQRPDQPASQPKASYRAETQSPARKKFERSLMNQVQPGAGELNDEQIKLLLEDMDTKENVHQARMIADQVEQETAALGQKAFGPEGFRKTLAGSEWEEMHVTAKGAITNYTSSSQVFREVNHGWNKDMSDRDKEIMQTKSDALDATLQQMDQAREKKPRLTYRYIGFPYGPWKENPYGSKIQVGDVISDPNFMSTSAHKQFIQGGTQVNAQAKKVSVSMAIYGSQGVPIALSGQDVQYSNGSSRAVQRLTGKTEDAGQAEILYPRNSCFRVLAIQPSGDSAFKVILSEVPPDQAKNKKHAFTGEAM